MLLSILLDILYPRIYAFYNKIAIAYILVLANNNRTITTRHDMKQCVSTRRDLMRQLVIYGEPEMGGHSTLGGTLHLKGRISGGTLYPGGGGALHPPTPVLNILRIMFPECSRIVASTLPFLQGYVFHFCKVMLRTVQLH